MVRVYDHAISLLFFFFFFSSRRRHTRLQGDWSSDVCSSDLPPEMVVGVIAGGYPALVKSSEGAEDDVNAGMAAMDQARVTPADFVLGIAASGTTPFVRAALSRAQTIGAATGLVSCSDPPRVLVETC